MYKIKISIDTITGKTYTSYTTLMTGKETLTKTMMKHGESIKSFLP